jgi:hypothetical protein
MPIGFLTMSNDIVEDVRLTVEPQNVGLRAPNARFVPHVLVTINTSDEIQLANAEAAILHGDSQIGSGRPAVEMLIADQYLDLHPGVRIAFFPETQPHPSGAGPKRPVQSQNGGATRYVHKRVAFRRCCHVVSAMQILWLRTEPITAVACLSEKAR